jgi:hypothetical protein
MGVTLRPHRSWTVTLSPNLLLIKGERESGSLLRTIDSVLELLLRSRPTRPLGGNT